MKIAEQCRILFSIKRPVGINADPSANHVENEKDSMRKMFQVTYSRDDNNQKNKANSGIKDVSLSKC